MQGIFYGLVDVVLAFKFGGKISGITLKGDRIYRGKLHVFKEFFLGYVAFVQLQIYYRKDTVMFYKIW